MDDAVLHTTEKGAKVRDEGELPRLDVPEGGDPRSAMPSVEWKPMFQEQIEIMERFYGPPPPRSYWQPVKDAWNLYTRTEKWVLVGGWLFGLVMAFFLVRALW